MLGAEEGSGGIEPDHALELVDVLHPEGHEQAGHRRRAKATTPLELVPVGSTAAAMMRWTSASLVTSPTT